MIRLLFSIQPPQSHVYLTPDMIHAMVSFVVIKNLLKIVIVFYPIQK